MDNVYQELARRVATLKPHATLFRLLSPASGRASSLLNSLVCALLILMMGTCLCSAGQRGLPPQECIVNFGKVNDNLYRGAQPGAEGLANLKKLGIKTIINLRQPGKSWEAEVDQARTHGLVFTNIPFSGLGRPKEEDVRHVLALIEALPSPIFIHCEHGCDRTGTVIACYRIQHDKWSNDAALAEAEHYGISKFERGMRKYIVSFGVVKK